MKIGPRARACLVALSAAFAVIASDASAREIDPKAFSAETIKIAGKLLPGMKITAALDDPLKLTVKGRGPKDEWTIYLDRVLRYCMQASPSDCNSMRKDFITKISAPAPQTTMRSLRFVVRPNDYAAAIRAQLGPDDPEMAAMMRPIGDGLTMIIVTDAKDTIGYITPKELDDLGLTPQQAWDLALPHTRSVIPPIPTASAVKAQWQVYNGGDYLGSMLGLTEDWVELAQAVGPDLFVTVVADQLVVVGILPDGPQLDRLAADAAADCNAAPRCISPHVYRFREGRWIIAK